MSNEIGRSERELPSGFVALESDYKLERESWHSSETCYSVEARYAYHTPQTITGQVFDNRWRRVHFAEVLPGFGVPGAPRYMRETQQHGYYSLAAAQALRWWFHAEAEQGAGMGMCLETRLVEHTITDTYKVTAKVACAVVVNGHRP